MELQVNGERRSVAEGTTVTQLLAQLSIQPERVVVEVNLAILKRAQLPTTVLKDQDQVEIVHFVGGGSSDFRPQTSGKSSLLMSDVWSLMSEKWRKT